MAASTINTECKRYGCMKNLLACFANCRYTMRCDELRNELVDKSAQAENDINHYLKERGRAPILVQILKRGVKFDEPTSRSPRKLIDRVSPATIEAKPQVKPGINSQPTTKAKASRASVWNDKAKAARLEPLKANKPTSPIKDRATRKRRTVRRTKIEVNKHRKDRSTPSQPLAALSSHPAGLRAAITSPRKQPQTQLRKRTQMPRRAKHEAAVRPAVSENPAAPSQDSPSNSGKSENAAKSLSKRETPRRKSMAKSRKLAGNGKVYIILEGQTASVVDEQGLMAHLFSNNAKNTRYFEANEVEARVQIVLKR